MSCLEDLSETSKAGTVGTANLRQRGQNFKRSCTRYVYRQQLLKASQLFTSQITTSRQFGF
jgi:hypothetical protein